MWFTHNLNNNKVDATTEWKAALLEKTRKNNYISNYITFRKQELKLKRADTDIIVDIISRF